MLNEDLTSEINKINNTIKENEETRKRLIVELKNVNAEIQSTRKEFNKLKRQVKQSFEKIDEKRLEIINNELYKIDYLRDLLDPSEDFSMILQQLFCMYLHTSKYYDWNLTIPFEKDNLEKFVKFMQMNNCEDFINAELNEYMEENMDIPNFVYKRAKSVYNALLKLGYKNLDEEISNQDWGNKIGFFDHKDINKYLENKDDY